MIKFIPILLPILIVFLSSIFRVIVANDVLSGMISFFFCLIFVYTFITGSMLFTIQYIYTRKFDLKLYFPGKIINLLYGIIAGLILAIFCAYLFYYVYSPEINTTIISNNRGLSFVKNIYYSVVDEMGFRGAAVYLLHYFFGKGAAIIGGGLAYGIIDTLINVMTNSVSFSYLLIASLFGIFYSITFLRFGLLFCIGLHWGWSFVVGSLNNYFITNGVQISSYMFENSITSIILFSIICLVLFYIFIFRNKINPAKNYFQKGFDN